MSPAQTSLASHEGDTKSALTARASNDVFAALESETARMFNAIADKLEREPDLLTVPLNNIARWLAKGHPSVARLNAWKNKIEKAGRSPSEFAALISLLRDSSPEAMQWKGFSPFAGVLTPEELEALSWISHR